MGEILYPNLKKDCKNNNTECNYIKFNIFNFFTVFHPCA